MASKRSINVSASSSDNQAKKQVRQVSVATFQKWQKQEEKEHKTICWLRCDKQQSHVTSLWCQACRKFENNIKGVKNFSAAWIVGTANQKLRNVVDHARSDHVIRSNCMKHVVYGKLATGKDVQKV
jgi:hypothetical protein